MKFLVILLLILGFIGPVFAQSMGDISEKIWLPNCPIGTSTECDQSSLFPDAIALPFFQSDSVAVGTIVEKNSQNQNSIRYSIDVDFYLKNYQPFDLLTATLFNATEPEKFPDVLYYNSPVFNKGDLVFVYLKKINGQYNVLPESFALDKHEVRGPPPTIHLTKNPAEKVFQQGEKILVSGEVRKLELVGAVKQGKQLDAKLMIVDSDDRDNMVFSDLMKIESDGNYNYFLDTSQIPPGKFELEVNYGPSTSGTEITIEPNFEIWTPLKQFNFGISFEEIQCRNGLEPTIKINDFERFYCTSSDTKKILIKRGWAFDDSKACRNPLDCFDSGVSLDTTVYPVPESSPEPEPMSKSEITLHEAKKSLQNAYETNVNLGPFYMKDVIVGYGTYDETLIIDIPLEYTNSIQVIKKEIQHIVGDQVTIDYAIYDQPIERHISTVIPYLWNKVLHQKGIDYAPKNQTYWNNADGFAEHDKVCSPLVAPNGTEFYISTTFELEPFEITETYIDKKEPEGCHKVWKTESLMVEPDRITALWLKNQD